MIEVTSRWTAVLIIITGVQTRYALVIVVAPNAGEALVQVPKRIASRYAALGVDTPPYEIAALLAGAGQDALHGVHARHLGIIHSDPWEGA